MNKQYDEDTQRKILKHFETLIKTQTFDDKISFEENIKIILDKDIKRIMSAIRIQHYWRSKSSFSMRDTRVDRVQGILNTKENKLLDAISSLSI